jgi:hypothetical protein
MREFCKDATGADIGQADVPGRQRYCDAVTAPRIGIPRTKGGISAMAKKTAKGGAKKKGGKKR